MVKAGVMVAVAPLLSVTLIVTVPLNAAVGVPLIVPEEEPIVRVPGNPEADQVYGAAPPVAVIDWPYAWFAMPAGRVDGEIPRDALMLRVGVMVAVAPLLSVTLMVTVPLNVAVGVPLIVPEEDPIVSVLGNPVADQVWGAVPPVTVMFWLYGWLIVPAASAVGEMLGAWLMVIAKTFVATFPALS